MMLRFFVWRLASAGPVVAIIAVIAFGLLHLTPGDPARIVLGENATAENLAAVRTAMGLDLPLPVQFGHWLWGILHGDLGVSMISRTPVSRLIGQRIGPTVALAVCAMTVTIAVALPLSVWLYRRES